MKYVQLLTHEIGTQCNLSIDHWNKCPVGKLVYSREDRQLDDEVIVEDIRIAFDMGFSGMVMWQFYSEPLLYLDRIEILKLKILEVVPKVRFLLWTNGKLIGDQVNPERLRIFSKIVISNYSRKNWDWLKEYVPDIKVVSGHLDGRLSVGRYTRKRCLRLYHELIIDAYGNWRLCCGDYLGTAVKMNVFTDGFPAIVKEYQRLRELISEEPQRDVPALCQRCSVHGRGVVNNLVDQPFSSISKMLLSQGISPDNRRSARYE